MGRNSCKSGEPRRTRTSNRLIKSYILKNQQNADFPCLPPFRLLQPLSGELLIGRDGAGVGLESLQLDDYLPAHIVEFSPGVNSLPDNHVKNTLKSFLETFNEYAKEVYGDHRRDRLDELGPIFSAVST